MEHQFQVLGEGARICWLDNRKHCCASVGRPFLLYLEIRAFKILAWAAYAVTSSTLRFQMRSFFFSQRAQGSNTSSYPETNEFAEPHAAAAKVCTMTPRGCQTPCSTHCDWAGLLLLPTFGMPCTNGSHSHSQETCCMGFELPSCPWPGLRRPRQLYLYSGGMHWGAEQSHIT